MRLNRLIHARELLGKYYKKSVVSAGENIDDIGTYVRSTLRKKLGRQWVKRADDVALTIMNESQWHGLDPLFVVAVIEAESDFVPNRVGSAGEIGLMQLKPSTAQWIAERAGLPWKNQRDLFDPSMNIRYGVAYVAYLREHFSSHSRLYLAAYNMGARNVRKALKKEIWPKDYPKRVMLKYVRLYANLQDKEQREFAPSRELASIFSGPRD